MADPNEPLDREAALRALTRATRLQYRSALAYTIVAGSLVGLEHLALGPRLGGFAQAELDDCRRLIEKIVDLDGEPPKTVADIEVHTDPKRAVAWLVEVEKEAIDAIHAVIDATGGDSQSEALEHRVEHIVMRKYEQVESLLRAFR
jgi:ferritin-like protein